MFTTKTVHEKALHLVLGHGELWRITSLWLKIGYTPSCGHSIIGKMGCSTIKCGDILLTNPNDRELQPLAIFWPARCKLIEEESRTKTKKITQDPCG